MDPRTGGRTPVRLDLFPDDTSNVGIGGITVPPIFVKEFKDLDSSPFFNLTPRFMRRNISSFLRRSRLLQRFLLSGPL